VVAERGIAHAHARGIGRVLVASTLQSRVKAPRDDCDNGASLMRNEDASAARKLSALCARKRCQFGVEWRPKKRAVGKVVHVCN